MTEENNNNSANTNSQKVDDSGGGRGVCMDSRLGETYTNAVSTKLHAGLEVNKKLAPILTINSDTEEGFLSTSPDSNQGEQSLHGKCNGSSSTTLNATAVSTNAVVPMPPPVCLCTNSENCVTLKEILDSFKSPLSEEQAWALLYQFMVLYQQVAAAGQRHIFNELEIPEGIENLNLHRDGAVHCSWSDEERKEREQKIQQQQQHKKADEEHEAVTEPHGKY